MHTAHIARTIAHNERKKKRQSNVRQHISECVEMHTRKVKQHTSQFKPTTDGNSVLEGEQKGPREKENKNEKYTFTGEKLGNWVIVIMYFMLKCLSDFDCVLKSVCLPRAFLSAYYCMYVECVCAGRTYE